MSEPDDFTEWEEFQETDKYFEEAKDDLKNLYEENKDAVYFKRQLLVKFEKKYFHWLTSNALNKLKGEGHLKTEETRKEDGTSRRYFMHPSNRYYKREINKYDSIIDQYSDSTITRSCGHRAEDLFSLALMERGFTFKGRAVTRFEGKTWEKTGHDLDFIFEREGSCWGCEIKNSLGYIDQKELIIKLEMCKFFGVRPLFIMRYSPKTYIDEIYKRGGFAMIFVAQIYDLSQAKLVEKMRDVLGLPVDCPKAIPSGIIDRFEGWLKRKGL